MEEQTIEEVKNRIMEYLVHLCFDKGTIETEQLFPIALYLYQNAYLGPKGTKKVAAYLVKLNDILKQLEIDNLQVAYEKEETRLILEKLDMCFDHKPVYQFIQQKANEVLSDKHQLVCREYQYTYEQKYSQLKLELEQKQNTSTYTKFKELFGKDKDYIRMYMLTKEINILYQLEQQKKEGLVRNLKNAQVRLSIVMAQSIEYEKKKRLANIIAGLDAVLQRMQYEEIQEETTFANAIFAQATRSASYQKQIEREIISNYHSKEN